jgi:alanine dehydrogenase
MAGQMGVQLGAQCLNIEFGGRGILLGTVPGVPPPTVLILGAGMVGRTAARVALASGAHVIVIDEDLRKLEYLNNDSNGQVVTVIAGFDRLEKYTSIADVVIGAVLIPGGRAPFLVTESMVQGMKQGSVVIDISIDQGGCVETSRPTTIDHPTFVKHGVVHYCVPNMTANIARTASRALASSAIPYLLPIAGKGIDAALRDDPGLASGAYLYRGKLVNAMLGETLGVEATPIEKLLREGANR